MIGWLKFYGGGCGTLCEREREREREHYMGVGYGLKGVLGGCLVTSILMC